MIYSEYTFVLEVTALEGEVIHKGDILHNLMPCYDELLLQGICEGHFPNDGTRPAAVLHPMWADSGAPRVSGFSMSLPPVGFQKLGLSLLQDDLRTIMSSRSSQKQSLKQEQFAPGGEQALKVQWGVKAYERPSSTMKHSRLSLKVVRPALPVVTGPLRSFGVTEMPANQQPVALMIDNKLLDQLRQEAANSLDQERANILTGYLVKDPGLKQPVVIILNKISADTDTEASEVHFAFSPLTFQSIQKQLSERANGEIIVGWWHNHVPTCRRECLLVVPPCQTNTVFFSSADRAVQRSSFFSPYMVGFVSGKGAGRSPADPETRAYGWQAGHIVERSYKVF